MKEKLVSLITKYFPVLWISGFHLIILPASLLYIGAKTKKLKINIFDIGFIIFFCVMFIRSAFAIENFGVSRVLSAYYNISLMFTGFLILKCITSDITLKKLFIENISKLFITTLIIYQVIFSYALYTNTYEIEHLSLLGITMFETTLPGLFESAKTAIYTRYEWGFGDVIPRVVYLGEFPTTSALILISTYCIYLIKNINRITYYKFLIFDMLVLISLSYTQSRVMIITFMITCIFSYFVILYHGKYKKIIFLYLPFILIPLIYMIFYFAETLFSFRSTSGDARLLSYTMGYDLVLNENLFFGVGVKPIIDSIIEIPVGSHSTIISSFVKYGLVGLIFTFLYLIIIPINLLFRTILNPHVSISNKVTTIRMIPIFISWLLFQDIDAYAISALLFFTSYGIWLTTRGKNEIS